MKYINQTLLILLLFTLASSCSKYDCDDCIYFRCKVDGKEWRMNCNTSEPFGCSAYDLNYYRKSSNNFTAYVRNDKDNSLIGIFGRNVPDLHTDYNLGKDPGPNLSFYLDRPYTDSCKSCDIDTTIQTNILRLTEIDTVNFIIAGTFEFVGHDKCGKPVQVSDGKFRLNYSY